MTRPWQMPFGWKHFNQAFNLYSQPALLFDELAQTQDLGPAWASLLVTTLLFSCSSIISFIHHIPYSAEPLWPIPDYRLVQAATMPLILCLGCLIGSSIVYLLNFILRIRINFKKILSICAPVFFVPLWLMMWPTDMAIALGLLSPESPGFPGLWAKHLMPGLTTLYMLGLLWLALWYTLRILLREAFALAVLALVAVLGFWALLLR